MQNPAFLLALILVANLSFVAVTPVKVQIGYLTFHLTLQNVCKQDLKFGSIETPTIMIYYVGGVCMLL